MANWHRELPEGYREVKSIDAKDNKTSTWFSIVAALVSVGLLVLLLWGFDFKNFHENPYFLLYDLGFIVAMLAYIVLHELVHGLVYKIVTHQKLTYGFSMTVAFCGVPELYVARGPMIVAILAPFVVFSIGFGLPLILLEGSVLWAGFALLFAIHIGGCVGDLYGFSYMATHHLGKPMLVNDTGPKQTFYIK